MVTLVERIAHEASAQGLTLHRCSPRGPDRLVLEFHDERGHVVAGQWYRDRERVDDVARRTARISTPGTVGLLKEVGVVVQRRGADRRLPALQELARQPGALLVTHRAERRGVVRLRDGAYYAKVVPPGRVREVASASSIDVETGSVRLARVVRVDHRRGTVTTSGLPGSTLETRLAATEVAADELVADVTAVGKALRSFHESASTALPRGRHDAVAEVAVTARWLRAAHAFGLLSTTWAGGMAAAARRLFADDPTPTRLVHRDLHDKQLVIGRRRDVGLLDLDLAAAGEVALDIANLLAHLELRHQQGRCTRERALRSAADFVAGYGPTAPTLARVHGYLMTSRLRLAAVYAFRNARPELLEHLIHATCDTSDAL